MSELPTDQYCECDQPEPALINDGMDSLCEKCGRHVRPDNADGKRPVRGYMGSTPWGEIDDSP